MNLVCFSRGHAPEGSCAAKPAHERHITFRLNSNLPAPAIAEIVEGKCAGIPAIRTVRKKGVRGLFLPLDRVNFYDPATGLTGIILILPAGFARPAPAENALAELRNGMRGRAEVAHVPGEALGILYGRLALLPYHRNLSFQLGKESG